MDGGLLDTVFFAVRVGHGYLDQRQKIVQHFSELKTVTLTIVIPFRPANLFSAHLRPEELQNISLPF